MIFTISLKIQCMCDRKLNVENKILLRFTSHPNKVEMRISKYNIIILFGAFRVDRVSSI